jgi:hypothetical protein
VVKGKTICPDRKIDINIFIYGGNAPDGKVVHCIYDFENIPLDPDRGQEERI